MIDVAYQDFCSFFDTLVGNHKLASPRELDERIWPTGVVDEVCRVVNPCSTSDLIGLADAERIAFYSEVQI